jgi:AraC-like DNA-binding protein
MNIERYIPSDRLKPFIKAFIVIESGEGMDNRLLPDTAIVMAFRYRGGIFVNDDGAALALPASVITGIRQLPRVVSYKKNTATFLVTFTETGAAAFFRQPLHELQGISLPLDQLLPAQKTRDIEEQLSEATANTQRVDIVERFLQSVIQSKPMDALVSNAVQKIQSAHGDIRIGELVKDLYISRDPFEKRFRQVTGATPKQFAGIVRLKRIIDNHTRHKNLTDAAHAAGYFDQAHFIKHFRAFTGQTPHEFFRQAPQW